MRMDYINICDQLLETSSHTGGQGQDRKCHNTKDQLILSLAEIVESHSLFMWKVAVILLLPMFSEAPRGASPKQFSMVYGNGGWGKGVR